MASEEQWHERPLEQEIAVEAAFFYGSRRKFDIDNANKLWADALTGIVYEDDSQIASLFLKQGYDKERPRIEITVKPLT